MISTAHSAKALRDLLGTIRLEPVCPDIGRPFYRAVTTFDALALIETPPAGAEGISFQRWRRRESNPGPRSCGCGFYERSRRSSSHPRLASPAGLSGASSLGVPGAEGANPLRASLLADPGSPPQASDGRDELQLPTIKQPRNRDRNCASPHLFSSGGFTRPPGTSARNHPHEPTTSKPVVPWGYWCLPKV